MANVKKVSEGLRVDYTPASGNVAAGAVVVVQKMVGVATEPIAEGVLGAIDVEGTFLFPKAAGTGTGIDLGKTVYWHGASTNQANETASGGTKLGYVIKAASDTDTTVLVKLVPAA
jgi:predicted RecA/RadA family phage recombinase